MGRNPNGSKKNKGKSKKGTKNKGKSKKGSLLDMVHQKWDLDDANNRLLGGGNAGGGAGAAPPAVPRAAQEALGRASYAGDAAAAHKAVVEDGADVNAAVYNTYDGTMGGKWTAVLVAALYGHSGVLDVLLSPPVSADPARATDITGSAEPCLVACRTDHPDAVTMLLSHGADPNSATNTNGYTPCMAAAWKGSAACLRALSEGAARQGVSLDVKAVVARRGYWTGKTALDIAVQYNKEEAAAYLRDELGALRAAELPPPRKPPKSAAKINILSSNHTSNKHTSTSQ